MRGGVIGVWDEKRLEGCIGYVSVSMFIRIMGVLKH